MHRARLLPWTRLGVVLSLAVSIGVIASCTMTNEPTGLDVSLERQGPNRCVKSCAKSHQELIEDEAELHQKRMRDCRKQSDSQQNECKQAEIDRHKAAMDQIKASKKDCVNNCHRQGHGRGGDDD